MLTQSSHLPDIDIDVRPDFDLSIFGRTVKASMVEDSKLLKHPCGVYFQNIPEHKGLAAIPYKEAEALGYYKLDFLHNHVYSHFSSREEILELIKIEPNWDLLLDEEQVPKLFQLARHADLLRKVKPRSILELSDCLALIRPGKKEYLPGYLVAREKVRPFLYSSDSEGYAFKKSHSVSYAMVIVLQLHLIEGGIL